jgi:AraC family transcriptional regulator, melibiose operon regulatory protein
MDAHYEVNGLVSFRETREATSMPVPHSHNEIEMLLIERGGGTWSMGGKEVSFGPGSLIVFWALRPHHLIKSQAHTIKNVLTVPMAVFQEWELPEAFRQTLLSGNVVVEPDSKQYPADLQSFLHWHDELGSPSVHRQKLALLEIRARLGRMALYFSPKVKKGKAGPVRLEGPGSKDQNSFRKVAIAVDYVAKHFSEPMTVIDVAEHMGMEAPAATKMFKKLCGFNLMQYIVQHRLLYAQNLLARSDMKVADVARASGYGSAMNFHAAFKKVYGVSPHEYGKSVDYRKVPLEKKGGCSAAVPHA